MRRKYNLKIEYLPILIILIINTSMSVKKMYLLPIHIIIKVCIIAILCKKSIAHYYVIFVGTISTHRLSDGYRYNYRRGDIVIVIYIT